MTLPNDVLMIGESLQSDGNPSCPPTLFEERDVFIAEYERIFHRHWTIADHSSRLTPEQNAFVFDALTFAVVVTRDAGGNTCALRNQCPHAGYPVVRSQRQLNGCSERLMCQFHGWVFGLDGRLLPPSNDTSGFDYSRAMMRRYALRESGGLILVDLSRPDEAQALADPAVPEVPDWLPQGQVTVRAAYTAKLNWKNVLGHVMTCARAGLAAGAVPEGYAFTDNPTNPNNEEPFEFALKSLFGPPFERMVAFGPLSYLLLGEKDAAWIRVAPRRPNQTDLHVARISKDADGTAPVSGTRQLVLDPAATLPDREFLTWYWHQMTME